MADAPSITPEMIKATLGDEVVNAGEALKTDDLTQADNAAKRTKEKDEIVAATGRKLGTLALTIGLKGVAIANSLKRTSEIDISTPEKTQESLDAILQEITQAILADEEYVLGSNPQESEAGRRALTALLTQAPNIGSEQDLAAGNLLGLISTTDQLGAKANANAILLLAKINEKGLQGYDKVKYTAGTPAKWEFRKKGTTDWVEFESPFDEQKKEEHETLRKTVGKDVPLGAAVEYSFEKGNLKDNAHASAVKELGKIVNAFSHVVSTDTSLKIQEQRIKIEKLNLSDASEKAGNAVLIQTAYTEIQKALQEDPFFRLAYGDNEQQRSAFSERLKEANGIHTDAGIELKDESTIVNLLGIPPLADQARANATALATEVIKMKGSYNFVRIQGTTGNEYFEFSKDGNANTWETLSSYNALKTTDIFDPRVQTFLFFSSFLTDAAKKKAVLDRVLGFASGNKERLEQIQGNLDTVPDTIPETFFQNPPALLENATDQEEEEEHKQKIEACLTNRELVQVLLSLATNGYKKIAINLANTQAYETAVTAITNTVSIGTDATKTENAKRLVKAYIDHAKNLFMNQNTDTKVQENAHLVIYAEGKAEFQTKETASGGEEKKKEALDALNSAIASGSGLEEKVSAALIAAPLVATAPFEFTNSGSGYTAPQQAKDAVKTWVEVNLLTDAEKNPLNINTLIQTKTNAIIHALETKANSGGHTGTIFMDNSGEFGTKEEIELQNQIIAAAQITEQNREKFEKSVEDAAKNNPVFRIVSLFLEMLGIDIRDLLKEGGLFASLVGGITGVPVNSKNLDPIKDQRKGYLENDNAASQKRTALKQKMESVSKQDLQTKIASVPSSGKLETDSGEKDIPSGFGNPSITDEERLMMGHLLTGFPSSNLQEVSIDDTGRKTAKFSVANARELVEMDIFLQPTSLSSELLAMTGMGDAVGNFSNQASAGLSSALEGLRERFPQVKAGKGLTESAGNFISFGSSGGKGHTDFTNIKKDFGYPSHLSIRNDGRNIWVSWSPPIGSGDFINGAIGAFFGQEEETPPPTTATPPATPTTATTTPTPAPTAPPPAE